MTCLNGHDPAFTVIRSTGARVCTKCRDHYAAQNRQTTPRLHNPTKVTPKNAHRTTI